MPENKHWIRQWPLKKRDFMKAIQPFIADDQQLLARKIINHRDYTVEEYAKITLASKSRVLFNTDSFIKQIEDLFSNPKVKYTIPEPDDSYSEIKFKVPQSQKKKYQELQNKSAFNESLEVTPEAKKAIIKKAYTAMHHSALGRDVPEIRSEAEDE